MAIRENTFLLKRSNVPGKVPLAGDIQLGEIALNTADVKLYTSGTTENDIIQIGWDRINRTGDTVTGDFMFNGDFSATTISATTYLNLPTIGGGGDYLPLSGGTVTGDTIFTNGLTATTISATTYQNLPISGLTEGNNIDLINNNGNYTISLTGVISGSGVNITFTDSTIYNSPTSPATGNITSDLTEAKIGVVQKIYHNNSVTPTFPSGWVKIDGDYATSIGNIIFAEWISGSRVEYWIVNDAPSGFVPETRILTINGSSQDLSDNRTFTIPIVVGTTNVTSGTDGRVFFQAGGVVQQSASLFWDNTNSRLGVGATPSTSVRLDVRAQGTLSTDIAFRVRNSANNADMFYTLGNGTSGVPWGDGYTLQYGSTAFGATISKVGTYGTSIRIFQFGGAASTVMSENGFATFGNLSVGGNAVSSYRILSTTGLGTEADHILLSQPQNGTRKASMLFNTNYQAGVSYNTARLQVETYVANSVDRTKFNFWASNGGFSVAPVIVGSLTCKSNILLGTPTEDINDSNTIYIPNGTAPTTSVTDGYKQYSADIVTGNAAPHFRTENGSIIKLYRETTSVTASMLVTGVGTPLTDTDTFDGYTLQQIVKALRNLGVLA